MIKEILSDNEYITKQLNKTFPDFNDYFPEEIKLTLINMIKSDETVTIFPNTVEVTNSNFKTLVLKICQEWVLLIQMGLTELTCFYRQNNINKLKAFISNYSD